MVIILNPNDELKLINFQNQIIESSSQKILKHFPLWIETPFINELKDSKKINRVTIVDQDINNPGFFIVEIIFNSESYITKIQLFEITEKLYLNIESTLFPFNLKIFRLGQEERLSKNSIAINDSVWVKLKKPDSE